MATRKGGVVSLAQLRALGLGAGAVKHRVGTGRLLRIHRGVYAVGHRALGPVGHRWAAVLACGAGAVLSHRSAAQAWGLRTSSPARGDVSTRARSRVRVEGVRLHRVRSLDAADRTELNGLPITTVARTLVDLAEVLDPRQLDRAVHEAEVLRLLDLAALETALGRANGRRGVRLLASLVAERTAAPPVRSELEHRFLELCRAAHLPAPRVNTTVRGHEVDILWPDARLVVELDGRAFHATARAFEADPRRDTDLVVAGYRLARFTWRRVVTEPEEVKAILRALLGTER